MARVKCIMMQKNEVQLLDAWFRYYGHLFGFENLQVFDNRSTDPGVLETLRTFESAGAVISRGYDRIADFHGKGFHFKNIIRHWDNSEEYDFAIPVDCDEFLALFDNDGITCNRNRIDAYFDTLLEEKRAFGIEHCLHNVPGYPGHFVIDPYRKSFLASRTVREIDHGFHACESAVEAGVRDTKFVYLHMHNKSYDRLLSDARQKLAGFVDVDDLPALTAYTGPGIHLVRYFSMTRKQYHSAYDERIMLSFQQFPKLMTALGATAGDLFRSPGSPESDDPSRVWVVGPMQPGSSFRMIRPFDGVAYTLLNEDVRNANMAPLKHYLVHGYFEGRHVLPQLAAAIRHVTPDDEEAADPFPDEIEDAEPPLKVQSAEPTIALHSRALAREAMHAGSCAG